MNYKIRMGVPDMDDFWKKLVNKKNNDNLNKNEDKLFRKLVKILKY